jgi:hypothetical protein
MYELPLGVAVATKCTDDPTVEFGVGLLTFTPPAASWVAAVTVTVAEAVEDAPRSSVTVAVTV